MAVAVVERYKQESMVWTVLRDNKKVAVVERWPLVEIRLYLFFGASMIHSAALSTLRKDWRFKNQNDLKGIIIRVSGKFQLLRVFKITAKE